MSLKDLRTKYLFIVLGLVGALSAALSLLPSVQGTLQSALIEFAVGVFIAIVLAITVERYATEQFRREVDRALQLTRESVFEAVFSTMMPDSIFKEIRELILAQPFVRKDVYAAVSMRWPADGDRETLDFTTAFAYDVRNLSARTQKYTVYAQLSRPNDPRLSQKIEFHELSIGGKSADKYTGERLESLLSSGDTHLTLRKVIEMGPGGSEHIAMRFWRRIECEDYYTLNMGYPTEGLTLVVDHPEDIVVKLRVNHPSPDRLVTLPSSEVLRGWKLEGGILPYQGLEIWWFPSDRLASTEASAEERQP